jgi:hypothetical protein
VTAVHHNALKVAASPTLGGEVLVTFDQLKHWNSMLDFDNSSDEEEDFQPDSTETDLLEATESVPVDQPVNEPITTLDPGPISNQEVNPDVTSNSGLTQSSDFYEVDRILKHKYQQGWKFLTAWRNYPVSSATWEPPKHFVMPNGEWNQIFTDYLNDKGLTHVIKGKQYRPSNPNPEGTSSPDAGFALVQSSEPSSTQDNDWLC